MEILPPEILILIFSHLSFLNLIINQRVNKKWYQVIDNLISNLPLDNLTQTYGEGKIFWEKRGRNKSLFVKKIQINKDHLFFNLEKNFDLTFDYEMRKVSGSIMCTTKSGLSFTLFFKDRKLTFININYYRKKRNPDIIKFVVGQFTTFLSSRSCGRTPMEYFEFFKFRLIFSSVNTRKKKDPISHMSSWLEQRKGLLSIFSFNPKSYRLTLNKKMISNALEVWNSP